MQNRRLDMVTGMIFEIWTDGRKGAWCSWWLWWEGGWGVKVLMETSRSPSSLHKFSLQDDILVTMSVSRAKPYCCVNKLIATSICIDWLQNQWIDTRIKMLIWAGSQFQIDASRAGNTCNIPLRIEAEKPQFPSLQFGKMFLEERNKEIPISLPFLFGDWSTENLDVFPFNLDECFQRMEPAVFVLHWAISWSGFPFQESLAFLLRNYFYRGFVFWPLL